MWFIGVRQQVVLLARLKWIHMWWCPNTHCSCLCLELWQSRMPYVWSKAHHLHHQKQVHQDQRGKVWWSQLGQSLVEWAELLYQGGLYC